MNMGSILPLIGGFFSAVGGVLTIVIAFLVMLYGKRTKELASMNTPLTYRSTLGKQKKSEIQFENSATEMSVAFPYELRLHIDTGKPMHVYSVTISNTSNRDSKMSFSNLVLDSAQTISIPFQMSGNPEELIRTPLDFFVVYVDMNRKATFDYFIAFPVYERAGEATVQINGQAAQDPIRQYYIAKSSVYHFTNFDLMSDTAYNAMYNQISKQYVNVPDYNGIRYWGNTIIATVSNEPLISGEG